MLCKRQPYLPLAPTLAQPKAHLRNPLFLYYPNTFVNKASGRSSSPGGLARCTLKDANNLDLTHFTSRPPGQLYLALVHLWIFVG